ncbi:A disintegrin and metalloproteinase with thrombospondin motifs like isoform X2 [Physella acuta]|uniref:A disintegrin and metalloproteinase with thrombospondin motifs like isoform X2 n=1 Tax=Physella acuta TaxID=109671 RepID=UPI0027DDCE9A|nr:A disintegrin and metalloproteinase with thrombospondin motifs like isoform X2 [Physella acuta]
MGSSLHMCLLLCSIVFTMSVQRARCVPVKVTYDTSPEGNQEMPEQVNLTLVTNENTTQLNLRLVGHINPNVPVYTIGVDKDGKMVHSREHLAVRENIGYYQDAENFAAFQIIRTDDTDVNRTRLSLTGEFRRSGEKFLLKQTSRAKRDVSSQDETYELSLVQTPPLNDRMYDFANSTANGFGALLRQHAGRVRTNGRTSNLTRRTTRRRKQAVNVFTVDIAAVVDYGAYRLHYARAKYNRTLALQNIREYYAFIFNGVDVLYQGISNTNYRIKVQLIKIIAAETSAASPFTRSAYYNMVDAYTALNELSTYVYGSGSALVSPYDHVMLFIGYDLTAGLSTSIVGLAYIGTLCSLNGSSTSVIEDLVTYQAVDIAAHELGHSLSAKHDGDMNVCSFTERYIMASSNSEETPDTKTHPWMFSHCSVEYFTSFIEKTLDTARGRTCLTTSLLADPTIPDASDRLPGQEMPPSEQCALIYGSGSYHCRHVNISDVCTQLYCFDPSSEIYCYASMPLLGTTCASGKLCRNGMCVSDPRAPVAEDDCLFGDSTDVLIDQMTCARYVGQFNGRCYDPLIKAYCCSSCKNVYRDGAYNCEYGDRVNYCNLIDCATGSYQDLKNCCGTCSNVQKTFAISTTTTTIDTTEFLDSVTNGGCGLLATTLTGVLVVTALVFKDN